MALDLAKIISDAKAIIIKHSPEILIGVGISGMFTTTILAVKSTPKAMKLIDEKKKAKKVDKLTIWETIEATWKCYILPATIGIGSAVCIIGANGIHTKRNAAAIAACTISETAFKNYQEKVVEKFGERKEQQVREEVVKEAMEKNPLDENNIIYTGQGDTVCFDPLSGRYFKHDFDKIRAAVNDLNRRMRDDNYITLNEFYNEIGLESIDLGENLGWCIDKGYIDISSYAKLSEKNVPCLGIMHNTPPLYLKLYQ